MTVTFAQLLAPMMAEKHCMAATARKLPQPMAGHVREWAHRS